MLNGSFLLNFQRLISQQAPKWKRLLLVVDRPSSPRKIASSRMRKNSEETLPVSNVGMGELIKMRDGSGPSGS
jgi:hypothetical protein